MSRRAAAALLSLSLSLCLFPPFFQFLEVFISQDLEVRLAQPAPRITPHHPVLQHLLHTPSTLNICVCTGSVCTRFKYLQDDSVKKRMD